MFNIKNVLEENGHQVIPFSIKNTKNEPNNYENYFLETVDDEAYFAQTKKNFKTILKSFSRMFYSFEAKRKFKQLLKDTNPDLVYALQYHNKISPSFIYAAKKSNIPVIHRISDFQYMCPNGLFYNDKKGICEDCLIGKRLSCVKYKCVLNSYIYSGIKMLAKAYHDLIKISDKVDSFVIPSSFTLKKLNQYGIPLKKLNHIPTFFNIKEATFPIEYTPFALFIGRIEKQKGLMTLIKAFEETSYNLKIIGFSNNGYENELKDYLKDKKHSIEFLGEKDFNDIIPYLSSCLFTVVPSEWYDNFPNVILESFAHKKPVVATNIGSLPELVKNNETGLTFDYASVSSLKEKIDFLFQNPQEAKQMGENAYSTLIQNYSPQKHYDQLIKLFQSKINDHSK